MSNGLAILFRLFLVTSLGLGGLALAAEGGAWVLVVLVVAVAARLGRQWPGAGDTHGSARFGTAGEARAAGMTAGGGVHLGRLVDPAPTSRDAAALKLLTAPWADSAAVMDELRGGGGRGPTIRLTRFAHAAVFGASGGGKTAGVVAPTLLDYPGSLFVLDPKGELYRLAAARRRARGRHVGCIDPYGVVVPGGGDRYNPMGGVAPDSPLLLDLAHDFANALVVRPREGEREPFFNNMAESILHTFITAALLSGKPADRCLAHAADLIADPEAYQSCLGAMQLSPQFGGVVARLAHQLGNLSGRERATCLSSVSQHISFLNSPASANVIRDTTFQPVWLRGTADLFLVLPAERFRSQAGMVRYLITGLLRELTAGPADESRPVLFVLDEAAVLQNLPVIEDAIALFRGWGLKFLFVFQSTGQVADCFPGPKTATFYANMSATVFARTNDYETAKAVSDRLGPTTVLTTNVTTSTSTSVPDGGFGRVGDRQRTRGTSLTRTEHGRPLLTPDEVLGLPQRTMVVFTDRTPPLLVTQERHYERRAAVAPGRLWKGAAAVIVVAAATVLVCAIKNPRVGPAGQPTPWADVRPAGGASHGR